MSSPLPDSLVEALGRVRSVGVVTGAGISRAAGLPTYRGQGGLYDDPEEGERTVEALSAPTLARDPERTWDVLLRLARGARAAAPTQAHRALVELERRVASFTLLTQNVDGLHALAGSREVIEIHGNVLRTRCEGCDQADALPESVLEGRRPRPPCPACGGVLRPDVVLFGEALPGPALQRLHERLRRTSPDLVLTVGTSALFPYIVEPALLAVRRGCLSVEINPAPTDASRFATHVLRGTAEEWLPPLVAAVPCTR